MLPLIFMFLLHAAAASSASVKPDRLDIVAAPSAAAEQQSRVQTPPTERNELDLRWDLGQMTLYAF